MSIKINIPSYLQSYTQDKMVVETNGRTIGHCLKHLSRQFPDIEKMLFAQDGRLHSYVDIYINGEDAYPDELTRDVKDGDELHILYIIGGG